MADFFKHLTSRMDHRPDQARLAELLEMRLELLNPDDRLLPEMILKHHLTYRQLARLTGKDERLLARRVKTTLRRLAQPEYITVLRHPDHFSDLDRRTAYDRFLLGLSIRALARKYRWTFHHARTHLRKLENRIQNVSQPQNQ